MSCGRSWGQCKVYVFDLLAYSREIFMERRFAREVLPALQARRVERVPLADEVPA
jgi:hypothetical protein